MSTPVFSSMWYRVAPLRPRLTAAVQVERHVSRRAVWHVLFDPQSGRALRLNAAAYAFAARLDGTRSVAEVWNMLSAADDDAAPTQDQAIEILWRLHGRRLLEPDPGADFESLFRERAVEEARETRRRLNPLAFSVRIGNPTRLLHRLDGLARQLFSWPMLVLWCATVGYFALLAAARWSELEAHAAKWLPTTYYVVLSVAIYPLVKALHELAHGLALRRWGCESQSAGVTFFLLMPLPFVDASNAAALPRASQRISISAAGIMTELFIAALAIGFWLDAQPGILKDIAFVAAFTASVSTLLANGNPLLRFDGYYVFIDALDLPNLASRSARYWEYLLQRYALRRETPGPFEPLHGERIWLALYTPLSWTYRAALFVALSLWVAQTSFFLGVAVAAIFGVALLVPAARALYVNVFRGALTSSARTRVAAAALAGGIVIALVTVAVPAPFATVAQGVVWLPDEARLRTETEGFVAKVEKRHGERVAKGDIVLVLRNERVSAEHEQLRARIAAIEADLYSAAGVDPLKAANAGAELAQARDELARAEERLAGLAVRAGTDGTLVLPPEEDVVGNFAAKGTMLGHVLTGEAVTVRVALPQDDTTLLTERVRAIHARLASAPEDVVEASLSRDTRAATTALPSAALSRRYGGSLLTDPDDKQALKPLEPIVLIDVRLRGEPQDRFGERAWVRFDYPAVPLAQQWSRRARQVLLRQLNPAT